MVCYQGLLKSQYSCPWSNFARKGRWRPVSLREIVGVNLCVWLLSPGEGGLPIDLWWNSTDVTLTAISRPPFFIGKILKRIRKEGEATSRFNSIQPLQGIRHQHYLKAVLKQRQRTKAQKREAAFALAKERLRVRTNYAIPVSTKDTIIQLAGKKNMPVSKWGIYGYLS